MFLGKCEESAFSGSHIGNPAPHPSVCPTFAPLIVHMRILLSFIILAACSLTALGQDSPLDMFTDEELREMFTEDEIEALRQQHQAEQPAQTVIPDLSQAPPAQEAPKAKVRKPYPESFGDVFGTRKALMGKNVFSGSVGHSMGRLTDMSENFIFRNNFFANLQARIYKELIFTTSLFAFYDQDINTNVPWIADYFYGIKWFNWRPKTFSYGYENFVDNKYDRPDKFVELFLQGFYFVSWNHNLPQKWIDAIRLDQSTNFNITYMVRYFAQYRDPANVIYGLGKGGWGEAQVGVSMRYTVWKRIYLEAAAFYYPDHERTQVMWDPDFTYGFGYFDYRAFRFSITYGNWVMNRFPFNPSKPEFPQPTYGILDGDLRFTFNWAW